MAIIQIRLIWNDLLILPIQTKNRMHRVKKQLKKTEHNTF